MSLPLGNVGLGGLSGLAHVVRPDVNGMSMVHRLLLQPLAFRSAPAFNAS